MRSILDYIKVFKNIETYKDPKLRYAKAEFSPVFDPDLEQSEFLRPGETLEDWKPNPFLKPHADGGRIGLKPGGIVEPGVTHYGQGFPMKVTAERLEAFDNYIKNTDLSLKEIGEKPEFGYKQTKPGQSGQLRRSSPLVKAYERIYGEILEERFKPFKFTKDSSKVKKVIELFENGMSKRTIAHKMGMDTKEIRSIFHKFAKQYIGDENHPTGEGKNAVKKRRLKLIKEMKAYWKNKPGGKEMLEEMKKKLKSIKDKNLEIKKKVDGKYVMTDQEILNNKMFREAMGLDVKGLKAGEGINFNRYANLTDADYVAKIRAMAETNRFYQPEHLISINKNNPASMIPKNIYTATGQMGGQLEVLKNYVISNPKGEYVSQIDELFTSQGLPTSEYINKTLLSKEITSPLKNIKGAISMELLDDVFKAGKFTVGTAGGILKAARKMGAEFEVIFILGEYFNNIGRGQKPNLAWANAKQSATFGLQIKVGDKTYGKSGDKEYFEELKKLAKEEGIDPSTFEKVYEINKREHLATTMGMTGKLSPAAQIKTLEDQLKKLKAYPKIYQNKKIIAAKEKLLNTKKEQLEKYKKETLDKEYELIFDIRKNKAGYRNNIRPNLQKIADTPVYEEEYSDAFKNLGNIAVKYLDIEKKKAYNPKKPRVPKKIKRLLNIPADQSEQLYSDMGPLGNLLSTSPHLLGIFDMDIFTKQLPEMAKYVLDFYNPRTPLPKTKAEGMDFRTEAQKEQARILDMVKKGGPGELYRYNLARDVGPGITLESFLDLAKTKPGLGIRTGEASGGRAGYMGGGIAGIRKPNAIPPERQGLRSIMINGKKS